MPTAERLFAVRVQVAAEFARAFADANPDERLVQQLQDDAPAGSGIDALIARYRAGSLSLSDLITQARQALSDHYDDALDDVSPDKRGSQHVLTAAALFGALGGLSALAGQRSTQQVGSAVTGVSLTAGAGEFGSSPTRAEQRDAAGALQERLDAIRANLDDGTISAAQAAQQMQTATANHAWTAYQTRRNDEARTASKATASYVLDDSVKQHCQDCIDRADSSPYPIDEMPGIPGDGSTECGPGDQCDVEYGDAEPGDSSEEGDEG